MKRRIISMLLALSLALTLLPVTAWAEDAEPGDTPLQSLNLRADSSGNDSLYTSFHWSSGQATLSNSIQFPCPEGCRNVSLDFQMKSGVTGNDIMVTQGGTVLENLGVTPPDSQGTAQNFFYNVDTTRGAVTIKYNGTVMSQITLESKGFQDVKLNSLTIRPDGSEIDAPIVPAFSPTTPDYNVKVPAATKTVTVTPTVDPGLSCTVHVRDTYPVVDGSVSVPVDGSRTQLNVYVSKQVGDTPSVTATRLYIPFVVCSDESLPLALDQFHYYNDIIYDGQPHGNLVTGAGLDPDKLSVKYDKVFTQEIEKLETVTDAGDYYVYVTYKGDGIYAPAQDMRLESSYSVTPSSQPTTRPLIVSISRAQALIIGTPGEAPVSVPFDRPYDTPLDLPGVTVKKSENDTAGLPGHWYATNYILADNAPVHSPLQPGMTYKAYVQFRSDDGNWQAGPLPIQVTTEATKITKEMCQPQWVPPQDLSYSPHNYENYPHLNVSLENTGMRPFSAPSYSFFKADGAPLAAMPVDVGTYKVRATVELAEWAKGTYQLDPAWDTDGDGRVSFETQYTIKKAPLNARVTLTVNSAGGQIGAGTRINATPQLPGYIDWSEHPFTYSWTLNGQSVAPNSDNEWVYTLKEGNTGTLKFTVTLPDAVKGNYEYQPTDLEAALDLDGATPVTVKVKEGAVVTVTHVYDGTGSCPAGEFPLANSFQMEGDLAGKNVQLSIRDVHLFKPDEDMTNYSYPAGDGYRALVSLALTGNDVGSYYLSDSAVEVNASVAKRSLSGGNGIPGASITLDGVNNTYAYNNEQEVKPTIKEVQIYTQSRSGSIVIPADDVEKHFTVSYANNMAPGGPGSQNPPTVTITAKPDSNYKDSASTLFTITQGPLPTLVTESRKLSIQVGEEKTLEFPSFVQINRSSGGIRPQKTASDKITVTGTAAGEAILCVQYSVPGALGEGTKVYEITHQITVSKKDSTSTTPSNPGTTTPGNPGGGWDYTPSTPSGGSANTPSTSGGVTSVSVKPSVSGLAATAEVSSSTSKSLVEQAVMNNSSNVTVRVEAPSGSTAVNSVTARIPAASVVELASKTNASLTVDTAVAQVTLPNSALSGLGGSSGTVTVTASKGTDGSVTVEVKKNGQTVGALTGGMKVSIPVSGQSGSGLVVVLVNADGTQTVLPKSAVRNGNMYVLLKNGSATLKFVDNSGYFGDMSGHWAAGAVNFVSSRGLFQGTDPGVFSPDVPMSRAMLVTVLHRLESKPNGSLYSFADVPADSYYAEATAWAVGLGITNGDGGVFNGDGNISREQLATMLYRYAQRVEGGKGSTGSYSWMGGADLVSDWAAEAMRWAVGSGIITGDNGNLNPGAPATRAEVAAMLERFVNVIAG